MQCPRCLAQNREGRRFCAECGVPFALPCSSCGFANEPGEKYCGGCGLALTPGDRFPSSTSRAPHTYTPSYLATKILTLKSAVEGERKQVTVLFADLKDSTELIRGLDPVAAQRLLDPALQRMMDAVHRFEGTVNQVLGDGIMALFGAPIAHEDHALRACYAALAAGLGSAYALQGRLAEGCALLEEAISESIRTGGLSGPAHRVAWLSEVCRLAGRGEEAWQHAHEALDLARQQKARGEEAHALHQLGAVQAHANPPDAAQAEAYFQQALALAEDLGMRPLQAHCHLGLGTLYTKIGRRQQAHAELSAAIDLYRAMEMNFWLPQAEAALAKAASSESTGEADA